MNRVKERGNKEGRRDWDRGKRRGGMVEKKKMEGKMLNL